MSRRLRLFAALLALFAFSAYFAESVYATLCLPGAGGHTAAGADAGGHGHHAHHGGMHHPPAPADGEPAGTDAPDCPLGMAAGASCVSVSLPATTGALALADAAYLAPLAFDDSTHDQLSVASLFRPPRV